MGSDASPVGGSRKRSEAKKCSIRIESSLRNKDSRVDLKLRECSKLKGPSRTGKEER